MHDVKRAWKPYLATVAATAPVLVCAQGISPAASALRESKPILEMRWRSEDVDQTGMNENAKAVTLRGRVGFETGKAWNTALLAEADLLWPLSTHYNSTVNGKTAYPIVVDPETYEINRLQLANTSLPGTTLVLGRQRIALDDQRFIGNVGWRQNEQTFDSLRITNKSIANLTLDVSYLDQINRIYGKDSPVGRLHGDNYLANVSYQLPYGKLTGFSYLLDFEELPTDSSKTLGVRFSGTRALGKVNLAYSASYATQEDYAGNPVSYSEALHALELTGTLRQYTLGAGFELLGGNGVKGFSTPLATLHKFQGWADKFLSTPPGGIDDRYVTAGYATKSFGILDTFSATATWHHYESARLSSEYGSELNLELQARWQRFNAMLKYADYNADTFATDTRKLWLQVDFVW